MKTIVLYILCIAGSALLAQPAGFKPIENLPEFRAKFSEASKKISSIQSSFIQEKNLSVLEEKIISEGKFWYKRDSKVRLEYQKPFKYLMMMSGDQMVIRDEQKESRISTHSSKLFQQINQIILDCVNGSILENKDFNSKVFQNDKFYLLIMSPNSKGLKDFFQNIKVTVEKRDWSVIGITMEEPGGDNTIIKFADKVFNENLNDSLFVP